MFTATINNDTAEGRTLVEAVSRAAAGQKGKLRATVVEDGIETAVVCGEGEAGIVAEAKALEARGNRRWR